jgi:hypothetical protein
MRTLRHKLFKAISRAFIFTHTMVNGIIRKKLESETWVTFVYRYTNVPWCPEQYEIEVTMQIPDSFSTELIDSMLKIQHHTNVVKDKRLAEVDSFTCEYVVHIKPYKRVFSREVHVHREREFLNESQ